MPERHETNFNPPVEGGGDPAEHRQGMAFVTGILQAAGENNIQHQPQDPAGSLIREKIGDVPGYPPDNVH